jgi:hypothetical protein
MKKENIVNIVIPKKFYKKIDKQIKLLNFLHKNKDKINELGFEIKPILKS